MVLTPRLVKAAGFYSSDGIEIQESVPYRNTLPIPEPKIPILLVQC